MADEKIDGAQGAVFEPSAEQIAKARSAQSADELIKLAAEEGVTLDSAQAQAFYDRLHAASATGELADEELDDVAGGCGSEDIPTVRCPLCGKQFVKVTSSPYCSECTLLMY